MSKKLNIQIDQEGSTRLFIDDQEIGIFANGISLIDSINFSSNEDDGPRTEIIFKNYLGGLFESCHEEILSSLAFAITALQDFSVKVSIRWGHGLVGNEKWLDKYGMLRK